MSKLIHAESPSPYRHFLIFTANKTCACCYHGEPNRDFLSLNNIAEGIMRKDTTTAKLTEYEKQRNRKISKKRYIIEQYFGLSHLHDGAKRARFTTIIKNIIDAMCRQACPVKPAGYLTGAAFNIKRGSNYWRSRDLGGEVMSKEQKTQNQAKFGPF